MLYIIHHRIGSMSSHTDAAISRVDAVNNRRECSYMLAARPGARVCRSPLCPLFYWYLFSFVRSFVSFFLLRPPSLSRFSFRRPCSCVCVSMSVRMWAPNPSASLSPSVSPLSPECVFRWCFGTHIHTLAQQPANNNHQHTRLSLSLSCLSFLSWLSHLGLSLQRINHNNNN